MQAKTIKFISQDKAQFFADLRKRIDAYFTENKIEKTGNAAMFWKTFWLLLLYFGSYGLIISSLFSVWQMLGIAFVMGIGQAGIGMSIMHDANHGSYSKNTTVNKILGNIINLIGGNTFTWKTQHNLKHHTYTNIHEHDDDIDAGIVLRLSPHQEYRKFHNFQHIYALFLYGLLTINWSFLKDFFQVMKYQRQGYIKLQKKKFANVFMSVIVSKIFYFSFILLVPFLLLDNLRWWQWLIGYFVIHFITGVILSVVFQLAHLVEGVDQPIPNETGVIENDWAIHQLNTTADFSRKNKLISWYVGGLNFQVEHHLFPAICHIHYEKISEIVKATAIEYEIPYVDFDTVSGAIRSHWRILKSLGHNDNSLVLP